MALADCFPTGRTAAGSILVIVAGIVACSSEARSPLIACRVNAVSVAPANPTVEVQSNIQLSASVAGTGCSATPPVVWQSSATQFATVSGTGVVTGVAQGTASISATADGISGSTQVQVINAAIASIEITPASPSLRVGETLALTAVPRDSRGQVLTGRTITWATLSPSIVTVNQSTGVITGVSVGQGIVVATGEGITRQAVVTVTAAAASVSLSFSPAALTIAQGGSAQAQLNANRSNYTGTITLSASGIPAGMTLTFNPLVLTGNSASITVNVSSVAAGVYNLTITGASGAAGNPTATLPITVTVPTGSNFVWEFCNTDDVPLKFWRLSGTTWTEVAPTVVGNVTRFSFNISSTSGGAAFTLSNTGSSVHTSMRTARQRTTMRDFNRQAREKIKARMRITNQDVNQSSPFFDTFVIFGLVSELTGYQATCVTTPVTVAKTFTVTGMAGNETGQLGYGPAAAALSPATSSYNLMVAPGSYDWMAAFGTATGSPSVTFNWTAYRIGGPETAPGAAVAINRTGATVFTAFPFTVTGGSAGSFYLFSQNLQGARGQILSLPIGTQLGTTNTGTMLFLAPGDRLGTDLMSISITNINLVGSVTDFRSSIRYLGSAPPASGSFALPQGLPAFAVSAVAGAPVPTWQAAGSIPTDYQGATSSIFVSFTGANSGPVFSIEATRGWLTANGMSTNYTLAGQTFPGFLAAWAPAAPLDDASVLMFASTATTTPVAGSVFNFAYRLQD